MWLRLLFTSLLGIILFVAGAAVVFLTRTTWLAWIADAEEDAAPAAPSEAKMAKLSSQAQKNLGLTTKPLTPTTYWRHVEVPGTVEDRPGLSDRGVTAPVAGVVSRVYAYPGETVRAGDRLFALRLTSEYLQTDQSELFKTMREIQIVQDQVKLLKANGADQLNPARTQELDNQLRRLSVAAQAHRQNLAARGLSQSHINQAAEGKFVTELEVVAPPPAVEDKLLITESGPSLAGSPGELPVFAYEVEALKVDLGQQVQAGQTLCLLANHQSLYIEGRSFKREAALLEQAAENRWPIRVEVVEDDASHWPKLDQTFTIHHLANAVDPDSRTFAFYLLLTNQSRAYQKDGKTFLAWRFRPGQRVRLSVPVEEFGKQDGKDTDKVFVLPSGAVAREGSEAYIFRQNGDLFERRPVHVLFEDRNHIVLANDGSVRPGIDYVAQGAAASLNRIVKAQNAAGGLPPGAHFHADGSLHVPGK
jgi:multidrug efflux pump subunit AcrA (membrane-fusion protein)